jgi:hypothetical protein
MSARLTLETDSSGKTALRLTSYLLLAAGISMVLPYPLFYGLKIILQGRHIHYAPGHAFMAFLVLGGLLVCAPLLTIPYGSLWVLKKTGSHEEKFRNFGLSCFRYLPVLTVAWISMLYSGKTSNFMIPGFFGGLLIVYSAILLKLDR